MVSQREKLKKLQETARQNANSAETKQKLAEMEKSNATIQRAVQSLSASMEAVQCFAEVGCIRCPVLLVLIPALMTLTVPSITCNLALKVLQPICVPHHLIHT